MAFTLADYSDLVRLLVEHPEWRVELRPLVLGDEILRLPAAMDRLAGRIDDLAALQQQTAQRLDQLTARVGDLAEMQEQTAQRLDQLTARVDQLAETVAHLAVAMNERFNRVDGKLGNLEGYRLESWYYDHARSIFGKWLKPVARIDVDDLDRVEDALAAGRLKSTEVDDLRRLDILVSGVERGGPAEETILAVEVSATVNVDDVRRAEQRAETLRKAGYRAFGVAAGYTVTTAARHLAERLNVRVDTHRLPA